MHSPELVLQLSPGAIHWTVQELMGLQLSASLEFSRIDHHVSLGVASLQSTRNLTQAYACVMHDIMLQ